MPKYVALLRGIAPTNPNMRNEKLRGVFEALGFANVQTVISSGNVLFESSETDPAKLEERIEAAVSDHLGFASTAIVRSRSALQTLIDLQPFGERTHSAKTYLTVTFLKDRAASPFKLPYKPENRDYEILAMYDRAVCSVLDQTSARTPDLMVWLEKQFGKAITTRTWDTVLRILRKLS